MAEGRRGTANLGESAAVAGDPAFRAKVIQSAVFFAPLERLWVHRNRWIAVLLLLGITALAVRWFQRFPFHTLMGDDLYLEYASQRGGYASSFPEAFVDVTGEKYRPVLVVVLVVLTHLFTLDFDSYRAFNVAVLVVTVSLAGHLVWRLTGGQWILTAGVMIAATISRFDSYYVLQIFGVMEGLALVFVLAALVAAERAYTSGRLWPLAAANLFYFLAEFTHERYIVIGAVLVAIGLLAPRISKGRFARPLAVVAPVAIAALNYAVKAFVLHINFFTGGGGQAAHISLSTVVGFMYDGIRTIGGYDVGPSYLSGLPGQDLGTREVLVVLAFMTILTTIFAAVIVKDLHGRPWADPALLRKYLISSALFLPLLFSASVAFRQEYRWLYAPFVVLLIGGAWAIAHVAPRRLFAATAALCLFGGSVAVDVVYRHYITNTYFFGAEYQADAVRMKVIRAHAPDLAGSTLFFITTDPTFFQYTLASGLSFAVYAPGVAVDARYLADPSDICHAKDVRASKLVFRVDPADVVEVTPSAMAACR